MTKKNLLVLWACTMLACSFTFVSCSDDDDNNDEIEAGTVNANAKMFIGTWDGYGTWTFNEDGTCKYKYSSTTYSGKWSYNADTKTLITDVLTWNWEILNISEDSWTGMHLAGKKSTFTYTRIK